MQLDTVFRIGGLRARAQDSRGDALSCPLEVDGRPMGDTPWSGELVVGDHDWSVRCPGQGERSGRVTIPAEDVVEVVADYGQAGTSAGATEGVPDAPPTKRAVVIDPKAKYLTAILGGGLGTFALTGVSLAATGSDNKPIPTGYEYFDVDAEGPSPRAR